MKALWTLLLVLLTLPSQAQILNGVLYATPAATSQVATPTFTNGSGTYNNNFSETISDATGGSTICYTTDGTTPTAATPGTCDQSTYSSTIAISTTGQQLRALGTKAGMTNSVATTNQTYTMTVATPSDSPGTGSYGGAQTVTISDATTSPAPYICYTTDGSTPAGTSSSCSTGTHYTGGFTSPSSTFTLKAIGYASNYNASAEHDATYTISTNPVALDGSPVYGHGATASSYTLAYSGVTVGDLLLVFCGTSNASSSPNVTCSPNDTHGAFTQIGCSGTNCSGNFAVEGGTKYVVVGAFYKVADVTGATITITNSQAPGTASSAVLYKIKNQNASPIDNSGAGCVGGGSGTSSACNTALSFSGTSELALAMTYTSAGGFTWTVGTGYTCDFSVGNTSTSGCGSANYGMAQHQAWTSSPPASNTPAETSATSFNAIFGVAVKQ